MTDRVRIVTDSNTMIPWPRLDALDVVVVPLTITIGGDELVEDRNLDVAQCYRRLRAGEPATTSAPSPGAFANAYERLGGHQIVSVHIGANFSGTANAARLGANAGSAHVRIVDTGAASFLAGCCVLAAAEAASDGADVDAVVRSAEHTATVVETMFTVAEIDRAVASGRLPGVAPTEGGVALVRMIGTTIERVATVFADIDAADAMFEHLARRPERLRIGVGDADAGPVVDDLVDRLRRARPTDDIVRYVVGPTVAAHAGMGTFGVVFHPLAGSRQT